VNRAVLCCVAANVLAGTTFVVMRRAPGGLPDVTFTAIRLALSSLLFFALAARRGGWRPRFDRRDWLLVATVALPGFVLPLLLGLRGVALSTPSNASILALMEPIAIVPLALVLLGEHATRARWLGLALGLAGAALVVTAEEGGGGFDRAHLTGNVLLTVQGLFWGIYTVAAKPLLDRHPSLTASAWITLLAFVSCSLIAPLEWPALRPAPLDSAARLVGVAADGAGGVPFFTALGRSFPAAAYLGIVGSGLSVLLWNAGLKGVDASKMAVFIFLQPAVGVVLDLLCFGERPALRGWIGLALIMAAVLLVTRKNEERPAPPEPATRAGA
jgi:drug/metabolite transporter (DMT)-like permease